MTASDELTALSGPPPGAPRCSALVPVLTAAGDGHGEFLGIIQCWLPGVARVDGRCACGHARDGWLCESCLPLAGRSGCRECLELETGAHECPLATIFNGGAS